MISEITPQRCPLVALLCLVILGLLSGCATVPPVDPAFGLATGRPVRSDEIRWPDQYRPEQATFFVHNEIEIAATPEVVWDIILRAEGWPTWYAGAEDVQIQGTSTGVLQTDSDFTWRTMDRDFTSSIREFSPPYRLAWESRRTDIQAYHAWLLVPTERGTRLITDESQHGLLAVAQKVFLPNKLKQLHETWLQAIQVKAEKRTMGH